MTDQELLNLYNQLMQEPESVPAFHTYYKEAYAEVKNFFDQVLTLNNFESKESYEKVREFLIDRYAKLLAFAKYIAKKETPYYALPNELIDKIFEQFGFTFHKDLTEDDKRQLVQSIVEIVKKKGSLSSIQNVLQLMLKYTKINLIELDLVKDKSGLWNLVNPETGFRYLVQEIDDNHWLTKLDTLSEPYQYRTPFFSFDCDAINIDDLLKVILFINKLVRDELKAYNDTGSFPSSISIDAFQINLSLTELWLWLIVLYDAYIQVSTGNNVYLAEEPQTVVVFDNEITLTDKVKHDIFYATANISNDQLKELTYRFYMQNFDRLEDVTYSEFDSYLASTWDDYYAYEPEVRKAYVSSAFFFMKLSKRKSFEFYIDELWDELTRLPKDYIEKYVSCNENPDKGLLYVFYDTFTKSYNDNQSIIVSKIIRNAEGQLSIINPKLVRFKDKVVQAVQEGKLTNDDFQLLIGYLLVKLSEYLFTTYVIRLPVEVFFGHALSFYTNQSFEKTVSELKPIYARFLSGNNVTKFKIDNKLLESVRYLLRDLLILFQRLYDREICNDHLKSTFTIRLADFINGLTHVYKFLDLNFIATYYNQKKQLKFECCDSNNDLCLSNLKVVKGHWYNYNGACCDNVCNWCNTSSNKVSFIDAKKAIAKNYKCLHTYVFDGAVIRTLRHVFSKVCRYNLGNFGTCVFASSTNEEPNPYETFVVLPNEDGSNYASSFTLTKRYVSDKQTHVLNLNYFWRYPILMDRFLYNILGTVIPNKYPVSVFDLVNQAYSNDFLYFLMSNADLLNETYLQKLEDEQTFHDKLGRKLQQLLQDHEEIHDNLTKQSFNFSFDDDLSEFIVNEYDNAVFDSSRYDLDISTCHLCNIYTEDKTNITSKTILQDTYHLSDTLTGPNRLQQLLQDHEEIHDNLTKQSFNFNLDDNLSKFKNKTNITSKTILQDTYHLSDTLTYNLVEIGRYDTAKTDSHFIYG